MRSIRLAFTHAIYEVAVESNVLSNQFVAAFRVQRGYQDARPDDRPTHRFEVTGIGGDGFAVCLDGTMLREGVSMPKAAYCVTQAMSDAFCSWVDEAVCAMHAASVLHGDGIVLFSGESGSGKTSLALEFSRYGKFIGDECAFLDMGKGTAWHEEFPFQLKAGNEALLSRFSKSCGLEVCGKPHGTAFYLPLDLVAFRAVRREDGTTVSAVVFPHFRPGTEMHIRKLPSATLPEYVLSSLMGVQAPSGLFARFAHMSAECGIRLYYMEFSDLEEAANELAEYLSKDGA